MRYLNVTVCSWQSKNFYPGSSENIFGGNLTISMQWNVLMHELDGMQICSCGSHLQLEKFHGCFCKGHHLCSSAELCAKIICAVSRKTDCIWSATNTSQNKEAVFSYSCIAAKCCILHKGQNSHVFLTCSQFTAIALPIIKSINCVFNSR